MAPKRSRGTSSSRSSFDSHQFVDQEAADWYQSHVISLSIVAERGIAPDDSHHRHLHAAILEREWSILVHHLDAGVVAIIWEFYANLRDGDSHSYVCGCQIPFDVAALNNYYQLPSYDKDDYTEYAAGQVDYTQIIQHLCRPGAEWTRTPRGEVVRFQASDLSVTNRV